MNHGKALGKLKRNTAHRRALLRNLATSLVLHGRIRTTLPRARELKRVADKLVTLGKKDTLHSRRNAMSYLFAINRRAEGNAQKLTAVHKLFTEIAPRYAERHGGYTRIVKMANRQGDNAAMALIEFVEGEVQKKTARRERRVAAATTESAAE
ncbi:MAG: 50S ribosomal protein L17 [Deltaproteobacteria bacterium]|nr:50S ribosomal protein L17 [Deltaproteobacteria bacterium]